MRLEQEIKLTIGWCFSLGTKFMRVVPITTLSVQAFTLLSQVLLLLAFFLPLKVIILLGSEKIPNYFPTAMHTLKKDHLIFILSGAAALCYALYLACEIIIAILCKHGTNTLISKSSKLSLFENQDKVATQLFARFNRAISGAIFASVCSATLLYIYPKLMLVAASYITLITCICVIIYNKSTSIRTQFNSNYTSILNALSASGFLISFYYLVSDYLTSPHEKIFTAVISVLIIRQGLQRVSTMIIDIISLRLQHRQANALFYHSQPLLEGPKHSNGLDELQDSASQTEWITGLLRLMKVDEQASFEFHWHQTGIADLLAFRVSTLENHKRREYLFKIFGTNISNVADQEKTLIELQDGLPSLEWLGQYTYKGAKCHIFVLDGHRHPVHREIGAGVVSISEQLIMCEPSHELLTRYSRTRPSLEQRFDVDTISPLRMACTDQGSRERVNRFVELIPSVKSKIAALPKQVVSLDITNSSLLISQDSNYCISQWGNWRLEAIGSNWPIAETQKLLKILSDQQSKRSSLANLEIDDVILTARVYTLEKYIQRKDFSSALKLLDDLLNSLDSNEPATSRIECAL